MNTSWTPQQLKEIGNQLSHPKGKHGVDVGNRMHESNLSMTLAAIEQLHLMPNQHVLEIGHGSAKHLPIYFEKASPLLFKGLEISEAMHQAAKQQDSTLALEKRYSIDFQLYDGKNIPLEDNSIDRIITVNTLYFWKDPLAFCNELYRVLNTGGFCVVCFADKSFMEKLPFVQEQFTLYNDLIFKDLIKKTDFNLQHLNIISKEEYVESKTGEKVLRKYYIACLHKPPYLEHV
ncbi:MAG: class I SAM-dependent methyltransferase [Saprospiraceae bacterium]|nr:class I SAM-dependent methyltransferase [Saprospiraceae bacterium]